MAAPAANTPWSTGLLDCAEDKESCCLTFWCPCITMGRVAEIVDRGSTTSGSAAALYALIAVLTGCECQWIYSCVYRTKLRAQYGLQETPCPDICVHLCLEGLALCQEYRELRNRGFVMDIGWHANMERQQQGHGGATATAPPATQQMI